MNFERKKDPFETLRIGERASAIPIETIHSVVQTAWEEPNLDGATVSKTGQTVVLLRPASMIKLFEELQKVNLSKKLMLEVIKESDPPGITTRISPPIFYSNPGVKWPSSRFTKLFDPDQAFYIKDIVDKWVIVQGNFYKLSIELLDKYPSGKNGNRSWEV